MKCKICSKLIIGRKDKLFCSIRYKNYYHTNLRRVTLEASQKIDRLLHRNRSILLEIIGQNRSIPSTENEKTINRHTGNPVFHKTKMTSLSPRQGVSVIRKSYPSNLTMSMTNVQEIQKQTLVPMFNPKNRKEPSMDKEEVPVQPPRLPIPKAPIVKELVIVKQEKQAPLKKQRLIRAHVSFFIYQFQK